MRIVLDTAVFIAAVRSGEGAAAELLRRAVRKELVVLLDTKLAMEYRAVALRTEHLAASGRSQSEMLELIEGVEAIAEPVECVRLLRPLSPDPDDDMVLELALSGEADALVTNNVRHFALPSKELGLPVLTPGALLKVMRRTT